MNELLGEVPEWVPVHGLAVTAEGDGVDAAAERAEVEAAAARAGLPELRWPDPFPFDSRTAMLAATFAKRSGRAVAFSLAAMRQAFNGGRDLSETDNVLIAAAACELHPRAVLTGIETRSVREALDEAT
nr:hypothetical protein [Actinomycetota bacterium]